MLTLRRTLAASAALLLAASLLAGCRASGPFAARATGTQSLDQALPAGATSVPVRVEMFNGSIQVRAGDAGRVHADVETTGSGASQADAEADRAKIKVTLDVDAAGAVVLKAVYEPNPSSPDNRGASAVVDVPADATLDLQTSNGQVTTTGITGAVAVQTSNGGVTLAGLQSGAKVRTSNGAVQVDGSGLFDVETSNAKVAVRGTGATVRAHTSNGEATFEGTFGIGAQLIETSNASITVKLPAGSAFSLDARTSNAKVTLDGFTFTTPGAAGEDALAGTVGTGGPTVVLQTSNGTIRVAAQ